MKKLFILMLLLPTFAMAQSGAVFKLIANDGQADKGVVKDAAKSNISSNSAGALEPQAADLAYDAAQSKNATSTNAPSFAAPAIPVTTSNSPEKKVAKKEAEVAKREVSAATADGKPSVAIPFGQRYISVAAEQKSQTIKTDAQKAQMKVDGNPSDSESKTVAKP